MTALPAFADVLPLAASWRERLALRHGLNSNTLMADCRYGMIAGACREAISYNHEHRQQLSDALDKVLTNRFLGLPIFLLIMLAVFTFTFTCGEPFVKLIDFFFTRLAQGLGKLWPDSTLPLLKALVIEGVIGGVGGVPMFPAQHPAAVSGDRLPEGTGYMSRAAFVMDGFMHKSACTARASFHASGLRLHCPCGHGHPHHRVRARPDHHHPDSSLMSCAPA